MAQPETRLQVAIVGWWKRHAPPGWRMDAIEHGIAYHGDELARARQWNKLKAKGVKTGVEDLQITGPLKTFIAIELKAGKNTQSDGQEARQRHLLACGHPYHVCRSVGDVYHVLVSYMPLSAIARAEAEAADRKLQEPAPVKKARGGVRYVAKRPKQAALNAVARARAAGVLV